MAYTNIDDPSAHFTTTLWTGAGGSPRAITNDANSGNFQPDFVWTKGRNEAYEHQLYDSSRGAGTTKGLTSNDTSAEGNVSATYGYLSSFDSNGFTGTAGTSGQNAYFDTNAKTYAAWQWKANGGTTASNSNGSITSTVQANTDAGMSIVTYTGTGSDSTVGHGLGVAPNAIIIKSRSNAAPWVVWTSGMAGTTSVMELNTTAAEQTVSNYWYNGFSSTTFGLGSGSYSHNTNNYTYVAYCFAEKQGFSKFGTYVGNGSTDGAFIYTGFKPALVIVKARNSNKNWDMSTGAVSSNQIDERLRANLADAEESSGYIDFLSNGFKMRNTNGTQNSSGLTYIYMAFAENPFVTSTGIPTTAR
jgi:hypothetical protein